MDLLSLREYIESIERAAIGKGASAEQVQSAERALDCSFPGSFTDFLARFGWAEIGCLELYGLGDDVPEHLDLIRNTIGERTEFEPRIPVYLVPIRNDGAGNNYCIDCRTAPNIECPVVFWDHEKGPDQIPEVVADTYSSWLSREIERLL